MDTLQKYPIPAEVRCWLLQELWRDCLPGAAPTADSMAPYLDYYAAQCQRFSRDGGIYLCVKSHAAICDIAKHIIGDATRDEICGRLLRSSPNATDSDILRANTTVDLCASLGAWAFDVSEPNPLGWPGRHSTLRQAVEQRWAAGQVAEHGLDGQLGRCGNLRAQDRRFERFAVWHDRLWYTFWVAILVFATNLFFGFVQSIEGAVQVYLTWKALNPVEGPL
ncbi:hypothetical protein B0T26DRAFT_778685 [Lasiosphaeria miniovina]|uniref:Uncharacterized protein n=1 Tax=Lasiosphaeria miniovina TaxID=1954250 RepID=A0AA40AMC6_9PEZI|nr:uncharacterized protein B0T26DRAFT_778685 [Lasiosphaeria miniovina]KAK0718502.1 hypothetical protein B0T26DRAFT_778685 [Lasiosphaeria miniovina]